MTLRDDLRLAASLMCFLPCLQKPAILGQFWFRRWTVFQSLYGWPNRGRAFEGCYPRTTSRQDADWPCFVPLFAAVSASQTGGKHGWCAWRMNSIHNPSVWRRETAPFRSGPAERCVFRGVASHAGQICYRRCSTSFPPSTSFSRYRHLALVACVDIFWDRFRRSFSCSLYIVSRLLLRRRSLP